MSDIPTLGLTLWEPWASAIARGVKTIETRDWPAPTSVLGRRVLVTSAKRKLDWDAQLLAHQETFAGIPLPGGPLCQCGHDAQTCLIDKLSTFPFGHAVASAIVAASWPGDAVDFQPVTQKQPPGWFAIDDGGVVAPYLDSRFGFFGPGRWAHLLSDVHAIPVPFPIRGHQKYWSLG